MAGMIFVITPILGWSWPSLVPVAVALAAGYGYKKLTSNDEGAWLRGDTTRKLENLRRATVAIDEIVGQAVGDEVGRDERLVFERDEIRIIFRRDPRGKFHIDVLGPATTPASVLQAEARRFAREIVQDFVYNRVAREMEARGLNVVREQTDEQTGDIVLDVRRWKA